MRIAKANVYIILASLYCVFTMAAVVMATEDPIPDSAPPSIPENVMAIAESSTSIKVSWSASTDAVGVTGYTVLRSTASDGLYAVVGSVAVNTYQDNSLEPSTMYYYIVRAYDAAGNVSADSTVTSATTQEPPDTISPSQPEQVSASPTSISQIDLTWDPSTDNKAVSGYAVYRSAVPGGPYTKIGTTSIESYSDTGLDLGTAYYYIIQAYDAAGNYSSESNETNAPTRSTSDIGPPSIPSDLNASASALQIRLTWAPSTDDIGVSRYSVLRTMLSGGPYTQIGWSPTSSYTDNGLLMSTRYYYVVYAIDAAGNSSPLSNEASALTGMPSDTTPPDMPNNLIATSTSPTTIALSWSASSDNVRVVEYNILRSTVSGGPFARIGRTTDKQFSIGDLEVNKTYYFVVEAVDAAGNVSTRSSQVGATTRHLDGDSPVIIIPQQTVASTNPTSTPPLSASDNANKTSMDTGTSQSTSKESLLQKNESSSASGAVLTKSQISATVAREKSLTKRVDADVSTKLSGKILLQVESKGEAWYVDPKTKKRYYLANGETAYALLRRFGLGIKNADLVQIPRSSSNSAGDGPISKKVSGRILLQVESKGEAWYVNPADGKRYYMQDGSAAYILMKKLSIGIKNADLRKIAVGD